VDSRFRGNDGMGEPGSHPRSESATVQTDSV
jgi:hypothetical protein